MDIRLVVATIASVLGDTFPQLFLDGGKEGVLRRQRKAGEGQISRGEATRERGHIVALRCADLLGFNARQPEFVGHQSLGDAVVGQFGVSPGCCSVADKKGPVTVPGGSTIVGLGGVVPAFTVSAQEQDFVVNVLGGVGVERVDQNGKSLPLSQRCRICRVGRIGLVDKTKVDGCLSGMSRYRIHLLVYTYIVERGCVRGVQVLQEVSCDGGILDVRRASSSSESTRSAGQQERDLPANHGDVWNE